MTRFAFGAACIALCGVCLSNTPSSATGVQDARPQPAGPQREGQTSSLLADGTRLILGGTAAGRVVPDAFIAQPSGRLTRLPSGLIGARTAHSATVLSDGTVLIVGGLDKHRQIETRAEVFNPEQRTFSSVGGIILGRSRHTATLLTDGRVLIAGGRGEDGEPLDTAQVWNPSDGSVKSLPLLTPREGHEAILQPDGTVLLRGGKADAELYVPGAEVVVPAGANPAPSPVNFAGSLPEDGRQVLT